VIKNFDFKNILSELDEIDKLSATKNDSHIILEKSIDDIVKEVSSVLYNAACLGTNKSILKLQHIFNISLLMPSGPRDFLFFKDLSANTTCISIHMER
jgi:hypothetical protein